MADVRLQKFLSDAGIMSRRAAEKAISEGRITVNGSPALTGMKVDPEKDTVILDGKKVTRDPSCVYIALNKPSGVITSMSDEKGRPTVAQLVSDCGRRVYPCGRLDMYSEGLLLLTDDGDVANRIMHPSHSISKQYAATVTRELSEAEVRELSVPFELDGYMLRPFEVWLDGYQHDISGKTFTKLRFTLHEGRNREIRNICARHGLKIARLTRISVGKITLDRIEPGKWRYLSQDEIDYLKGI
ncbi:MAG: rRNA pseudouridine synthase [Clostridia bacterium]|nr:rRNA pseudouridine synthase [Clostridia bacterium]